MTRKIQKSPPKAGPPLAEKIPSARVHSEGSLRGAQVEGKIQNERVRVPGPSNLSPSPVKSSGPKPKAEVSAVVGKESLPKMVTVKAKYLRISSQKLNLMAKVVRRQKLADAERILSFSKTKAGKLIGTLLKSAKAAATEKGLDFKNLRVSQLLCQPGPSLKRGQPVARGSFHPVAKKMAHLVLKLEEDYGTES